MCKNMREIILKDEEGGERRASREVKMLYWQDGMKVAHDFVLAVWNLGRSSVSEFAGLEFLAYCLMSFI